eukprot:TRINITY_DN940_c0_g1_i10.p2 TRINITY_DN940_c0_g1~~TRINITY_DN940_c0_g1_i10.p2  ORF type:complete len:188 (-),score=60.49 TRINITY_DN940_c0_g1_i10:527-1090(-)
MAFISAAVGTPLRAARPAAASRTRPAAASAATRMQTRPGLPPGEDARENAPLRYYVPVPVETYEKRSFATVLPKTWEGEVVTIGAPDVPEMTEESIAEAKLVPLSASSTAAFLEYSNLVKEDRKAALAALAAGSETEQTGRATCGDSEGREYVSNSNPILVQGVKCIEYWGRSNPAAVPRAFGGPTA